MISRSPLLAATFLLLLGLLAGRASAAPGSQGQDHPMAPSAAPQKPPLAPAWVLLLTCGAVLFVGGILIGTKRRQAAQATPYNDDTAPPQPGGPTPHGGALNLQGELATIGVPAMLQMLATHTQPGTLVIHGRHSEKRIHFRDGLISSAVSLNRAKQSASGYLMNKLGYLLVRQGKISEKQRDEALEYCETHPRTRLGEALVESGTLDREALREALRFQAEGVIFSLYIFTEGTFEFIPGDEKLARNDRLDIGIADLLAQAARHEGEWSKISQAIPSLDTVLEFAPGGREKLHTARMTVHQQLVLSLIDGRRSIHDICAEATMLDFEVYNFLFLMVHAHILQLAPAADPPSRSDEEPTDDDRP